MRIQLTPPCHSCPIHHRGLEKSGAVCRTCAARTAYIAALGDDDIMLGRKPAPDMTPPPEAEHVRTNADMATCGRAASHGPKFTRKTLKRAHVEATTNPVGRPTIIKTVMAARRVALGLSRDDVSDAVGSTTRTIAWLESGDYPYQPKPSTLAAIARVLKIPADTLLLPVNQRDKSWT